MVDADVPLACVACTDTVVHLATALVYRRVTMGCRYPEFYVYVRTLNPLDVQR
uniref:Uncharacterized protein n=1 Tax=Anguilla anguilla TaxID=7936 RepID=A0A0E9UZ20_ANGAN